ncbi:MAG: hypothetical protein ABIJ40_15745 [Bacteroidota bacterium]|nr:hypothetical protein [Bacteroidota bacterium]
MTDKIINHTSTNLPQTIQKYLTKFAAFSPAPILNGKKLFDNIIVVPAIAELENIKLLLESFRKADAKHFQVTLILFVINNLKFSSEEAKSNNLKTIEYLKSQMPTIDDGLQIGIIDCASEGNELDEKDGGVGLARKIGMDTALTIFDYDNNSKKIIICLDADCTINRNYLTEIVERFKERNLHAAYCEYEHPLNVDVQFKRAIICCEIFLRYYTLGLKFAGSHFAVNTIGSTVACDVEAYSKVQGMNKRKAGEDFYFIEKLLKIYEVKKIEGAIIYPSSRDSRRVPFGTGQRVSKFIENEGDAYQLYSHKSFLVLKAWLCKFMNPAHKKVGQYLDEARDIDESLFRFLMNNDFVNSIDKIITNSKSENQIQKQKVMWFDGFRTLKLIHYLRDHCFPNGFMFDELDYLLKSINQPIPQRIHVSIPSVEIQIEYLSILRNLT